VVPRGGPPRVPLRVLGFVVLGAGALSEVLEYVADLVLVRTALPKDLAWFAAPVFAPTFWWALPAFTLLAIGQVVRRGCLLRAELDTVI
jgi:hypothetical protein